MSLADHIAAHAVIELGEGRMLCMCLWESTDAPSWDSANAAHAAHVAESWQEARTVRTLDQLRELPDYVTVLDAGGNPWLRGAFGWRSSGLERGHSSISLPARILHNPKEDQ